MVRRLVGYPLNDERQRVRRFHSDCIEFLHAGIVVPRLRLIDAVEGKALGRRPVKALYCLSAYDVTAAQGGERGWRGFIEDAGLKASASLTLRMATTT
jgi:hypothetical protein